MTSLRFAAAGLCAGFLVVAAATSAADAQTRRQPLQITVEPRSFLDAGKIAPVGQYDRHLVAANRFAGGPPVGLIGSRAFENLPGAIGAGANPFANSFYGPSLR